MKSDTRERLLVAAQAVFSQHGFEATTVHMIAEEAGANIAAVNYHYGSKADLYAECVAGYLEESIRCMPTLQDAPDAPREQLVAFIRWFFKRYSSDSPLRQLSFDLASLGPKLFPKVAETVIRPEFDACTSLVKAIVPARTPPAVIRAQVMSIFALCVAPMRGSHLYALLYPGIAFDDKEVEALAEQAIRQVTAGLDALPRDQQSP
ncbi:MAG: TetR/AcrR family transcriptional regulator [Limisphaerales bacterium]